MKKKLLLVSLLLMIATFANASTIQSNVSGTSVFEMAAGQYVAPNGWDTMTVINGLPQNVSPYWGGRPELYHANWYTVGVNDGPRYETDGLQIVFHNIFNSPEGGANILNVYLYDNEAVLGLRTAGYDFYNTLPDWASQYNATWLGAWSYDGTVSDVVFSVTNPNLLDMIHNGGTFGIGIDPDCKFTFDKISVYSPVPEPATMLLFGMGLLGLAGITRKRIDA